MGLQAVPYFLTSLIVLAATCASEPLNLRNALQHRIFRGADTSPSQGRANSHGEQFRYLPPTAANGLESDGLEVMGVCVLASVDGKLHALNRTSGQTLWSMHPSRSTPTQLPVPSPSAVAPLVRTHHTSLHGDNVPDEDNQEQYIIEPQTGDIYILQTPDSPLQRFPFSMSQLIDMSPFEFPGNVTRVFVGKKETSLLVIELETGKIKATMDSTCPFYPFGEWEEDDQALEIDLDELEGSKPPKGKASSTEILIGRTDYHVSIYSKPKHPSDPRIPVQNLTFSSYGPNKINQIIQSSYHKTPDDRYIQPLPSGEILSLNLEEEYDNPLTWTVSFRNPIVAIFDVVKSHAHDGPFVLLQPQPRLDDFFAKADPSRALDYMGNVDQTYVGMIGESGSLFAMSPNQFPLVRFAGQRPSAPPIRRPTISGSDAILVDDEDDWNIPTDVEDVVKARQARKLREMCMMDGGGPKCLVGVRTVLPSAEDRLNRLLEGAPGVEPPPGQDRFNAPVAQESSTWKNLTSDPPTIGTAPILADQNAARLKTASSVLALVIFLVGLWKLLKQKQFAFSINVSIGGKAEESFSPVASPVREANLEKAAESNALPVPNLRPVEPKIPLPLNLSPPPPGLLHFTSLNDDTPKATTPMGESPNPIDDLVPDTPKPTINQPVEFTEGDDDESDKEAEAENALSPAGKKKGPRRRKRGKKKGKEANNGVASGGNGSGSSGGDFVIINPDGMADLKPTENPEPEAPLTPMLLSPQSTVVPPPKASSLVVSDEILGFGSHGTVVYRGSLQGRAVAVKRLLQDFVTIASREVNILQESDDHPNVIRYYYQEAHSNFLYIALELCPASLAEVVERPDLHREISNAFDPKRALIQITSGLRHLHALKIVHRDIKPQNILISSAKKGAGPGAGHRMLISDFGLCRKLEIDQTSFLPTAHGGVAAGTVGWRAPEILKGDVKLDELATDEHSQSSTSSTGTVMSGGYGSRTRLTKSVDIFALGCLFYYTLTSGGHPYGDRFEREANIMKDMKDFGGLESFGEEGIEAISLINSMLDPDASKRPDTITCLIHPFFWNSTRRLAFLQDASDRFEIMCRDPPEQGLISLETGAYTVVGNDWYSRLDKLFIENLGKYRKYNGKSVQDLMRALRNKKHHYQDLPDNVKRSLGPLPDGFLAYFTRRFPHLFMHVHTVISDSSLRDESMFKTYFELSD